MKVSGFTIVRNAIKFDYPVVESIRSVLPLCDEFIVSVGNSEDNSLELIKSIGSPKIKIIESVWDDSLRTGGSLLAIETNKAFDAIDPKSDWAFYIQADEVLHEDSIATILTAMKEELDNTNVEGLLFNYKHFYGSYDYVGDSRKWYRREIRVIRNNKQIRSYRDAQGFRKNNAKLNVKPVSAYIYHYGWVKPPKAMMEKQKTFHKMWHDDEWMEKNVGNTQEFDYSQFDSLIRFEGSHPLTMQKRVKQQNWELDFDPTQKRLSVKDRFLSKIEKLTGWRVGEYKNYKII